MNEQYKPLFEPFVFRSGVRVENRVIMAPMTNWSSNPDGTVSDAEIAYYERRSNGVGMVITACTYVTPNGKGFHNEFAGDTDEMIPSLRRLATSIKNRGAKAVLQIFHGGRQCPPEIVPNGETVSASAVPAAPGKPVPRELTDVEIEAIITAFGETTRRAIEAGYDGVEIHGANTYLIQQFFSPHSNRRSDRWGGTVEKRLAFPLRIVDEVKRVVNEHAKGAFLVGYRFSPEEPETPGITMADTRLLVTELAKKELDYLHVSLGDFWSKPHRGVEDTNRPRIEYIKEWAGHNVSVMGVGSLYTADQAAKAVEAVPLVAIGRELIIDPDWVEKVKEGRQDQIITTLSRNDQGRVVVPDPLWNAIMNSPGWFPVEG